MNILQCSRCGHISTTKSNLLKHLRRKTPCMPSENDIGVDLCIKELLKQDYNEKTYDCEYCDKKFNTWQSKSRHQKVCRCKPLENHHELETMRQKVVELEKKIENASTYTMNNNGIINNIQINAIGTENISYLTEHPKFKEFMVKCIKGKINGVCDYLVQKHFHEKHPENHNIRKLNKKDEFMELFDGRKWKIRYCDDILEDVFANMSKDFTNFVEEAVSDEGVIRKVWLDAFMEQVGKPLDWDFDSETYEYDGAICEEKKADIKRKIYKLACEYIYRHSKFV